MSGPIRDFTPTMSSMQMVDFINEERKAGVIDGKAFKKLDHADLMKKAPRVLGGGVGKFSGTHRHPQNGQTYDCYYFPKREACLMAMSYSYELQAKVFDRMVELEDEFKALQLTTATDRIPLHKAVPFIYERTGACYPKIYQAISAAAGADNFPGMTMSHLARVTSPLLRIRNESSTQADWDALHLNGRAIRGSAQLELTFAESPAYNPIKESS